MKYLNSSVNTANGNSKYAEGWAIVDTEGCHSSETIYYKYKYHNGVNILVVLAIL